MEQQEMKVCQSCGYPIQKEEDKGTNADGTRNDEYCSMCYMNGEFTQPNITMEEMIEQSAKGWSDAEADVTYEQAKTELEKMIPQLKRWKK